MEREKIKDKIYYCANLINRCQHLDDRRQQFARGQDRLLSVLAEQDGLFQNELTRILDIRPSSVSELVLKLEQNGLIERKANEDDKRIFNIFITAEGRKLVSESKECNAEFVEFMFSDFDDDTLTTLSALLDMLIVTMKTKLEETAPDCDWESDSLKKRFRRHSGEGMSKNPDSDE